MGLFRRHTPEAYLSPETVRQLAEDFLARTAIQAAETETVPPRIKGLVPMPGVIRPGGIRAVVAGPTPERKAKLAEGMAAADAREQRAIEESRNIRFY